MGDNDNKITIVAGINNNNNILMVVLIIIPVDTRSCVKELLRKKKKENKEYTANAIQTLQFPSNIITLCSSKIWERKFSEHLAELN